MSEEKASNLVNFEAEKASRKQPRSTARGVQEVVDVGTSFKDKNTLRKGEIPEGYVAMVRDEIEMKPLREEIMTDMRARVNVKPTPQPAATPHSSVHTSDVVHEPMLTAKNVSTGISCIMGGLLGVSAWSHVSQGLRRGEDGKMDTGKLSLGAVEALLSAGMVYLALEMRKPEVLASFAR